MTGVAVTHGGRAAACMALLGVLAVPACGGGGSRASGGTGGAPASGGSSGGQASGGAGLAGGSAGAGGTLGSGGNGSGGTGPGGTGSGGTGSGGTGPGGTGPGGNGGGGGGAGIGGSGGNGGTAGAGAGGTTTLPCQGQVVAAQSPVTLAVTLNCTARGEISLSPTSATDTAFVAFRPNIDDQIQVAHLAPGGVSAQATGVAALDSQVLVDEDDAPLVVAGAYDPFAVALLTPSQPGWSRENISPIPGGDGYNVYQSPSAAVGSDGRPVVLYGSGIFANLNVAKRAASGVWSATAIGDDQLFPFVVTVDSQGRTRAVYRNNSTGEMAEWIDGTVFSGYPKDDTIVPDLAVASGASGTIGVARVTKDGIAVTISDGKQRTADQVIAGTGPYDIYDLYGVCRRSSSDCEPDTCKRDGVLTLALASTTDGALWVAYVVRHLDYDRSAARDQAGNCVRTSVADRSTEQIELVRLATGSPVAPSKRWTFPVAPGSAGDLDLVARGPRLYLAFSEDLIHVFVFDWSKL